AMTAPRSRRLKAAFLRLAAAILMAVSFSGLAAGGEASTTHRAGDLVVYRFACHDPESMTAIAERGGANELAAVLVERRACFRNPTCIAARLEAWVAGPYPPDYGQGARGAAGSVWRVADQFGDTEYVWINDSGGRHAGRREMAL
ncbi:MAG: hypothetical protein V3S87_11110, partial [Alphaproteobacteria bacterium]